MNIKIKIVIIAFAFASVLLIGIAIPKLTVRDAVIVTDEERNCVQAGVQQQFDHPLQRFALALGKSAVVGVRTETVDTLVNQKLHNTFIVKLYTIFRIPIPVVDQLNRATLYIACDPLIESIKEIFVSYPMYLPDGKDARLPLTLSHTEFASKIQSFVVKNIGQPIEGFSATVYLDAFPGLLNIDFNDVETLEGIYAYSNGKLNFARKESNRRSSAYDVLVEKGYETLLSNIRDRLGPKLSVDEIINGITAQGIGRINGKILLGSSCPVLRDPPGSKCANKPIFGEFIVQNALGNVEFTRFVTQRDGSFSVSLPAGEYYITWAESLGPGIQGHLVNARAGETSEYAITFERNP